MTLGVWQGQYVNKLSRRLLYVVTCQKTNLLARAPAAYGNCCLCESCKNGDLHLENKGCDLDFEPSDLVLVGDTLSHQNAEDKLTILEF